MDYADKLDMMDDDCDIEGFPNECDKNDVICSDCKYIDSEGDCDTVLSRYWGECVDGTVRECAFFEQK